MSVATEPARRRRRSLAGLAAVGLFVAGVLAGCSSLDERQRQWIFQPSDTSWAAGRAAAAGMQDVWIEFDSRETGERAKLHGLWLPQADAAAPVLLYLHGARWDLNGSAPRMRRMHELGFSVLGIDYRGFGRSTPGLPSESMAYEDAHAAWAWLAKQAPQAPHYVFGHSLGSAVAVQLASEAGDVAGLVVEGSFTSIPAVFSSFKWGWLPVGPLITQRFDAASRIGAVKVPVLVVHGSEDQLIRPELGRALYEKANQPKRFVLVDGGSHHNTNALAQAQYRAALAELFGLGATAE